MPCIDANPHRHCSIRELVMQAKILTAVKAVIDLDKDDPSKEDRVKALRTEINTWVAKYRREPKVSGRPSYG